MDIGTHPKTRRGLEIFFHQGINFTKFINIIDLSWWIIWWNVDELLVRTFFNYTANGGRFYITWTNRNFKFDYNIYNSQYFVVMAGFFLDQAVNYFKIFKGIWLKNKLISAIITVGKFWFSIIVERCQTNQFLIRNLA